MDLAASIQEVTEEAVLGLARRARDVTGSANLCLAGGVALNCVANGRILREGIFDQIWIQPAAGDARWRPRRSPHRVGGGQRRRVRPADRRP